MNKEVDPILFSTMLGRVIEDIVYRQLEDLQRQGNISDKGLEWLRDVSSATDKEGKPKQPINFERIDQDLRILIDLKEEFDKQYGLDDSSNDFGVDAGPSA